MEENEDGVFRIKMVNVLSMIENLEVLYAKGVDYIDLYQTEEEKDTIIFFFVKEYINEKYRKDFKELFDGEIVRDEEEYIESKKPKNEIKGRLTSDDINNLL